MNKSNKHSSLSHSILAVTISAAALIIIIWLFNTNSLRRGIVDWRSNHGGLYREITVYLPDGSIDHFEGKIDIEKNNGTEVKFDYDGKRYIYYNCKIKTVADY